MMTLGFIKQVDESLAEQGLGFISNIIDVALTFFFAWLLVRVIRIVVRRAISKRKPGADTVRTKRLETASTLAVSVSKYVIYFMACVAAIGQLGLTASMTSLLTAAGIGGLVLGIGAQSLVKDVVSGVFMLFEDQYSVGDYITAAGVTGTVRSIALRTTTVESYTGEMTVIPNGSITALTNYSRTDTLAVVDVPIAADTDIEKALALMGEEAKKYHGELGETAAAEPEVLGTDSARNGQAVLRVTMKVAPLAHWAVQRELTARILARFTAEGIAMPYARVCVESAAPGEGGAK